MPQGGKNLSYKNNYLKIQDLDAVVCAINFIVVFFGAKRQFPVLIFIL